MKKVITIAITGIVSFGIFTGTSSANYGKNGLEIVSQHEVFTSRKPLCVKLKSFNLEQFKTILGSKMGESMFHSIRFENCQIKIDNYYLQLAFSQWASKNINSTLNETGYHIVSVTNENFTSDGNMRFATRVYTIEEIQK